MRSSSLAFIPALLVISAGCGSTAASSVPAALERLLGYANMSDGDLDERLRALPLRPFADAATCLYELGWVTPAESDERA